MAIYQRWHPTYEKYFYRPIACCNIRTFYIVQYPHELEDARTEVADEEDTDVITVEEYEKIFGEKFNADEDYAEILNEDIEMTYVDNGKK